MASRRRYIGTNYEESRYWRVIRWTLDGDLACIVGEVGGHLDTEGGGSCSGLWCSRRGR